MLYSTRTIVFVLAAVVCVVWLLWSVFIVQPLHLMGEADGNLHAGTASALIATFTGCVLGCVIDDYNAQRPLRGARRRVCLWIALFAGSIWYLWIWSKFTQEVRPVAIFGTAVSFVSPLLSALASSDPNERNDFTERPPGRLSQAAQRVFAWTNRIF